MARNIEAYKMKHTRLLYVMMVAAAFAGNAEAIYKCTTSKGVVYQDRPCREGNETDVQIVVPTGEVAPKYLPSRDESAQAGAPRVDNRAAAAAAKPARAAANDQVSVGRPGERSANESTAADDTRRKDARSTADNGSNPMTAEQARKTDPTAKYYTTDAFSVGPDTPEQMTCESPTGEKRRFLLTNGKLTSI